MARPTTPEALIAAVPEPKRSELATLHALVRKTLPGLEPAVYGKMIGYGRYEYRYPSGREGVSYRVAIAPNATGISVYVSAIDAGGWIVEQAADRLGKASCGKSCIRFKRLADLDASTLREVLAAVKKTPAPGEIPSVAQKKRKRA